MARRKIIEIDEDKCTGCGECVTKCAEGALAIVDGKAKVVNEVFCDGLGACIGDCPTGALQIIERDAPEFSEEAVKEHLGGKGHHAHANPKPIGLEPCGCPSHNPMLVKAVSGKGTHSKHSSEEACEKLPPELTNWPIQWKLVRPEMPFFKGADVLMAADCVPFAYRDFHGKFLANRPVIIGCPKLDEQEKYLDKLTDVVSHSGLKSINVVIMEVPCCSGLKKLVDEAVRRSGKSVPVKTTVVGIQGQILPTT
jgi:NAD-dependent dihydropyrimidine dehydrogenase PreA subunit